MRNTKPRVHETQPASDPPISRQTRLEMMQEFLNARIHRVIEELFRSSERSAILMPEKSPNSGFYRLSYRKYFEIEPEERCLLSESARVTNDTEIFMLHYGSDTIYATNSFPEFVNYITPFLILIVYGLDNRIDSETNYEPLLSLEDLSNSVAARVNLERREGFSDEETDQDQYA